MNFFKMLNGAESFSPEDIAEEIVVLENSLPKFKEAVGEAEKVARSAIQAKIGGGNISKAEVDSSTRNLEEARLNLDAAQDGLNNLQIKLKEIIRDARETELAQVINERSILVSNKRTSSDYISMIKAVALLLVSKEALDGPDLVDFSGTYHFYGFSPQERNFCEQEIVRLKNQQSCPTFFQKKSILLGRELKARISVDEQIAELMRKAGKDVVKVN